MVLEYLVGSPILNEEASTMYLSVYYFCNNCNGYYCTIIKIIFDIVGYFHWSWPSLNECRVDHHSEKIVNFHHHCDKSPVFLSGQRDTTFIKAGLDLNLRP